MDKNDTDDLMSTLGYKGESEDPSDGQESSSDDELSQFNIDNADADKIELSEPAEEENLQEETEEGPAAPVPDQTDEKPAGDSIPTDASYLMDSDFSDFTVDEKVISNYRSSLVEREDEAGDDHDSQEEPAPETASEKKSESKKLSSDKSTTAEVEPPQATFYLVKLYRKQGMFKRALNVLDTLKSLDVDKELVKRETAEIKTLMEKSASKEEAEPDGKTEAGTGKESLPEQEQLPPVDSGSTVDTDAAAAGLEAETVADLPADENDYENRRIAALIERLNEEPEEADQDLPEPESATPEPVSDQEQDRIDALMKRAGKEPEDGPASDKDVDSGSVDDDVELRRIRALEKRAGIQEETATEARSGDDETEKVPDESAHVRAYPAGDGEEAPADEEVQPRDDYSESETEQPEQKKWKKLVYTSAAVLIALVAVWLFIPGPTTTDNEIPVIAVDISDLGTDEPQIAHIPAESPVAVVDTVTEEMIEDSLEKEPLAMEEPQGDTAEPAPEPVKQQPEVKILPLRNLQVNNEARALFKRGDYYGAAQIWAQEKKQQLSNYTIVLLFACEEATVENAYENLGKPADYFILPRAINDRACFSLCWGDFVSLDDAVRWFGEVPAWFAENGANPIIRKLSKMRITTPPPVETAAAVIPVPGVTEFSAEPEPPHPEIDTLISIPEETVPEVIDNVSSAEDAFMEAMMKLTQSESLLDSASTADENFAPAAEDSVIVLSVSDREDDWLDMDTTAMAMEPKTDPEVETEEFVEIADLVESEPTLIDQSLEITAPERDNATPEPEYSPQDLLELGRLEEAAGIWEIQKARTANNFTVKLLVACQAGSVSDAYRILEQDADFFILPKKVDGSDCYAVCIGDFRTKRDASNKLNKIPDWFERHGKPVVSSIADISK